MGFETLLESFRHPPVLFFLLGCLAVSLKSDLEIPASISKFLSLYLLFVIGTKGGIELFHSGLTPVVGKVLITCIGFSLLIPIAAYFILRRRLNNADATAVAAAYGSISAVTFATALAYLQSRSIPFGGYMVACMALMESPAIISGLILYRYNKARATAEQPSDRFPKGFARNLMHEALVNGSVFLLMGSLLIGLLTGNVGQHELSPFIDGIFKGMLSLYMLDMGLLAGRRLKALKRSGVFLGAFALLFPLCASLLGIAAALLLNLGLGDALLLTVMVASASYIAVPAAMRNAVPEANMSLLLPMSLGITFTFNIVIGIPLYFYVIQLAMGG